ncbi:MAG: Ig-like domain-containing protein [Candidatus Competibacteraceae bacterium]
MIACRVIGVIVPLLLGAGILPARGETGGPLPTQVTVVSQDRFVPAGQPVTLTASVRARAAVAVTPTGTVEFSVAGVTLGTVPVVDSGGGVATASLQAQLPAGVHPILVKYHGGGGFADSLAIPPLVQRVYAR